MARKRSESENDSSASSSRNSTRRQSKKIKNEEEEEDVLVPDAMFEDELAEFEEEMDGSLASKSVTPKKRIVVELKSEDDVPDSRFLGDAVPDKEARRRWAHRYKITQSGSSKDLQDARLQARRHYTQAEIDGNFVMNLYDDAYVQGEPDQPSFICKVIEMFEALDGSFHFTAQWFYRACDTAIKSQSHLIDEKRVFLSEMLDDNPLGCLLQKLNIVKVPLNINLEAHKASIPECDFYYDMMYLLPCSTFIKVPLDYVAAGSETLSTVSAEVHTEVAIKGKIAVDDTIFKIYDKPEVRVLDLYAGCGAMSTGLCLGANISGVNLVTRWAVDFNKYACESLKQNHPETEVRHETADSFFSLLKEWKKLCIMFSLIDGEANDDYFDHEDTEDEDDQNNTQGGTDGEDFEVSEVLAISFGNPEDLKNKVNPGLYFKVSWKGYPSSEDTWEPREGLRHCRERVRKFVIDGHKLKILPLPGDADVICGGPPCQGVSGFNRFRNKDNPLEDPKNKQLTVYMDIVDFLKPKYVLMENVVDLLKFSDAFLGRHALGRLIQMNYQTRMGIMAAGSYGLPQYRNRVFIWGALPSETLPPYPFPTHKVINRGVVPNEFDESVVRCKEGDTVKLDKLEAGLLLRDAISDLPAISNDEHRDEMPYGTDPQSEFQRIIRLGKDELLHPTLHGIPSRQVVFDHRPLKLNDDDYERVCHIPKRKGACFRDLPGVCVRPNDNTVFFDSNMERVLLRSGKPLVPAYAMTFVRGTSSKPFARLWHDETVPTVVTRAEPHNQQIIHPEQDRVMSVRENARLQGFPDYYKLAGPIKERYIQVGNAVAVPVARALGYGLALAIRRACSSDPMFDLPHNFPLIVEDVIAVAQEAVPPISSEDET